MSTMENGYSSSSTLYHPQAQTISGTPTSTSGAVSVLASTLGQPRPSFALETHRLTALNEAKSVLDAIGGESSLDGFNLLTVIANPRTTLLSPVVAPSTSRHGSSHSTQAGYVTPSSTSRGWTASATDTTSNTNTLLAETYYSLEMTLNHVTEHMEALNLALGDWSRQLLENDPYNQNHSEDHVPISLLKELPIELQTLELAQLQSYLDESDAVANAFHQRCTSIDQQQQIDHLQPLRSPQQQRNQKHDHPHSQGNVLDTSSGDLATFVMKEVMEQVPTQFFSADFDLTNPTTFRALLLWNCEGNTAATASPNPNEHEHKKKMNNAMNCNQGSDLLTRIIDADHNVPIQQWFPLPPQDTFSVFLDRVELALLQQVRSKSDAFFEESLRFAQLQEWIQSLLAQTIEMQSVVGRVLGDSVEPMIIIPTSDAQRDKVLQLQHLLELAGELVGCKQSIAGYLSAQDDVATIEQIQYGRRLLSGNISTPSISTDIKEERLQLQRLLALHSVTDQLNQYENLVVTNLRDELVELLLEWSSTMTLPTLPLSLNASTIIEPVLYPTISSLTTLQHQQGRVREIFKVLRKCRGLAKAREAYGSRLQDMIRMTVRTIISEFTIDHTRSDNNADENTAPSSSSSSSFPFTNKSVVVSNGATNMNLSRFLDCLDMMFDQLLSLISSAWGVNEFCAQESILFDDDNNDDDGDTIAAEEITLSSTERSRLPLLPIITAAAELSSKSISELLRLRKEVHSLVTLNEMKLIWDKCMAFTIQLENLSGRSASTLRSTLLSHAKAFIERKHESNMSALAAALDSERWIQCDVSIERQAALSRLCYGRAVIPVNLARDGDETTVYGAYSSSTSSKSPEVEIEGRKYKLVWSCLLLMEMTITDLMSASSFTSLASGLVAKISELLRLFNARTTQLVLGAGAIHSAARLKSINAKHLSLVTQSLSLIGSLIPHIRANLMIQLPTKQHILLNVFDAIKKEYVDHKENILNKFVTIIGGIIEHGLAPKIRGTDFDLRAKQLPYPSPTNGSSKDVQCCTFIEGISTNARKMHEVLSNLLPPDQLQDTFSRIFAFIDSKVPSLLVIAAESIQASSNPVVGSGTLSAASTAVAPVHSAFKFPTTEDGKRRLLLEVNAMTSYLNSFEGVLPWEFTIASVLRMRLEIALEQTFSLVIDTPVSSEDLVLVDTGECTEADEMIDDCIDHGVTVELELSPNEVASETDTDLTSDTLTTTETVPKDVLTDSESNSLLQSPTVPSLQVQMTSSSPEPSAFIERELSASIKKYTESSDPDPVSKITIL